MNTSSVKFGITNKIGFDRTHNKQTEVDAKAMEELVAPLNKLGISDRVVVEWRALEGKSLDPEDQFTREIYGVYIGVDGEELKRRQSFSRGVLKDAPFQILLAIMGGAYQLVQDGKLD